MDGDGSDLADRYRLGNLGHLLFQPAGWTQATGSHRGRADLDRHTAEGPPCRQIHHDFYKRVCDRHSWFISIPPSNDRDWQPDVARLSWAEIDGDRITVHNIRNFEYRITVSLKGTGP